MNGDHIDELGHRTASRRRSVLLLISVVLIASAICRLYASLGDFWLDEIMPWVVCAQLDASWEVLTQFHHETNHFLNSFVLYHLGPESHWVYYRIPSVLAGVGIVLLAALIASRGGTVEQLTAAVLTGGSYLLIHYSSEARGYSYLVFFSLWSFFLMDKPGQQRRPKTEILFSVVAVFGFLSQPLYLYCYATLAVWSLWKLSRENRPWSLRWGTAVRWHALPILFVTWLYFINIRHMLGAGGNLYDVSEIVVKSLSLTVGGPESGPLAVLVSAAVLVAFLMGLRSLWNDEPSRAVFFLIVVAIAPTVLFLAMRRPIIHTRYFLISVTFLLLLLSHVLAQLFCKPRFGKILYAVLLLLILCGNGFHTARLIRLGRGAYQDAMRYMAQQSAGTKVTIGSDHDFRNPTVLGYYQLRMPDPGRFVYYRAGEWRNEGPEWYLRHGIRQSFRPDSVFVDARGNRYQLIRDYPYAGLSGWNWFLFRNENRMQPPGP
jgi:hypothetical protein